MGGGCGVDGLGFSVDFGPWGFRRVGLLGKRVAGL